MRIVCVYSAEKPLILATEIPFGISMIATVLVSAGHEVQLMVLSAESPVENMISRCIDSFRPGLLCITAVSTQVQMAIRVANVAKASDRGIFTILGGHHASLNPVDAISIPTLDAICIGEGESAIVEVARKLEGALPVTGIQNLWIKRNEGHIEKNPTGRFVEDLDALPSIDRRLWDKWLQFPSDYPSVLLGRGCPFKCSYCANHAMSRLAEGKYVRFRSPENIVEEISQICDDYPKVSRVYLEVETFGADLKSSYRVFEALAEYNAKREKKLAFGVNLALTSFFIRSRERALETLQKMVQANVRLVNIGLESGSETIRASIRRPRYSNREVIEFAQLAREHGIALACYVMIGLPGETYEDYKETVRVCRAMQPEDISLSIFFPYLGTDLAKKVFDSGYVSNLELSSAIERSRPVLELPSFQPARVRREYLLFWFRVYWGHWPLEKLLVKAITAYLAAYPKAYSLAKRWAQRTGIRGYITRRFGTRAIFSNQ